MEDFCFDDELACLKASFDSSEFCHSLSSNSHILKFILQNNASVTFEIPPAYPQKPPLISVTATELTNSGRCAVENELRNLASESMGCPMIMDLVIKLQQLMDDNNAKMVVKNKEPEIAEKEDVYLATVLIDHMRQKKKYCDTLISWASELRLFGSLLFYQRWIFLLLQGTKRSVKEFLIRHRTVCIDVDSSGKRCKEKMSKILFEGRKLADFVDFSIKEMTSLEEIKFYFQDLNIFCIYTDVIQPIVK